MLLEITTTHQPASDLGFLLHKHPERVQSFDLTFGQAHVYYPVVSAEKCTVALLLDINPVELVRAFRGTGGVKLLEHYVNDRPYVASSFLSVAINKVFGSALSGRCKGMEALAETALPLEAKLSVLPVRGGESLLRRLYEPLGYSVEAKRHVLDKTVPEWGDSVYFTVKLSTIAKLSDLLSHLYVLIPVLDREKHYWVGDDEVEKLITRGKSWLSNHPEKELIATRYLKFRRSLARLALDRMSEAEGLSPEGVQDEVGESEESLLEKKFSLNEQRLQAVVTVLCEHNVSKVADLGCGEGQLLREFLKQKSLNQITGMDVSARTLEIAASRLKIDRMSEKQKMRLRLMQGSLTYKDKRLAGYDAVTVVEVIEHIDEDRLDAFERVIFEYAKPGLVVVTTPNVEFNVRFEGMHPGQFRHGDHRFEWTRQQFQAWANRVADTYGYRVLFKAIGEVDNEVGAPTQMAVFEL